QTKRPAHPSGHAGSDATMSLPRYAWACVPCWFCHKAQAEITAAIIPRITNVHVGLVSVEKCSTQGLTISHRPRSRLIHSSQTAKAVMAAIASTPITIATTQAFQAAVAAGTKPRTQGEMNNTTARTRLTQSWTFLRSR